MDPARKGAKFAACDPQTPQTGQAGQLNFVETFSYHEDHEPASNQQQNSKDFFPVLCSSCSGGFSCPLTGFLGERMSICALIVC